MEVGGGIDPRRTLLMVLVWVRWVCGRVVGWKGDGLVWVVGIKGSCWGVEEGSSVVWTTIEHGLVVNKHFLAKPVLDGEHVAAHDGEAVGFGRGGMLLWGIKERRKWAVVVCSVEKKRRSKKRRCQ